MKRLFLLIPFGLFLLLLFSWSAVQELSAVDRLVPDAVLSSGHSESLLESTPPPSTVIIDCIQITFLGVQYNPEVTSTWSYYVEELSCAQNLGNWMVELPLCTIPLSATPEPWQYVNPDPNYQMTGIKWNVDGGFEEGSFTVTVGGYWAVGTTRVGVKMGPTIGIGVLAGPVCVPPSPLPTDTPPAPSVTPTNTQQPPTPTPPQPTATSTPTNTPTPQPPTPTLPPGVTPTATAQPPTPTPPLPTATATQPGPTMTATPTLPPSPFNRLLLPVVFHEHSPGEPNNNCPDAHMISPNNIYYFYPDDAVDWYTFLLGSPGTVTVRVDNFVPISGQVAVYRGSDCGGLVFLGSNGDSNMTKIVQLGPQPAGRYFIFVANDGSPNNSVPYQLQVQVGP